MCERERNIQKEKEAERNVAGLRNQHYWSGFSSTFHPNDTVLLEP